MTGKRFTFEKNTGLKNDEVFVVIDNNTNEVFSLENERESNSLVIRMNEVVDENKQLKQQLRIFEDGLKSEIKQTKITMEDWHECLIDCRKLKEENEQLKKENQELHKLNQEYIDSLSDEKKETLSEMLNAILGDDTI